MSWTATISDENVTVVTVGEQGPAGPAASIATDAIWDAAGDMVVGTGPNTAARVARGTALQVWRVNAAGTGLEWAAASVATWGSISGTLSAQTDLQAALDLKAPLASPTFTGTPAAPTATAGDSTTMLANTAFVTNAIASAAVNIGKRQRVRASTTANITIATALNNGDILDGVTLATGDLVLVKNQTAPAENGVYAVGVTPARSTDFDTYNEYSGSLITVAEGSTLADSIWLCTSNDGGTLGVTAISFSRLVVAGEVLAANNGSDFASASATLANLGGQPLTNYAARRVIHVSKGTAATDTRGSNSVYSQAVPFETLEAARDAATSGDTIIVEPGAYTTDDSLAKNGVNWRFESNTFVMMTIDSAVGIWDDGGAAITYTVTGTGTFTRTSATPTATIASRHASSVVMVECLDVYGNGTALEDPAAIECTAGSLIVSCRDVSSSSSFGSNIGLGVVWINGTLVVNGRRCFGSRSALWSKCDASPTGDFYATFEDVVSDLYVLYESGSNTTAAWWVVAKTVRCTTNGGLSIYCDGGNRTYLNAQKIFGPINNSTGATGLLYVTAMKISAIGNGSAILPNLLCFVSSSLVSRIEIMQYDPAGFTGEMIKQDGSTTTLFGGGFVSGGAHGIELTGGVLTLQNMTVDTSGNASTNPIIKSGGTLTLDGCTLIAEATRDSISAPTAQSVAISGTLTANRPMDADVTLTYTGVTTGLAATSTALATTRTIGGSNFDGTGNVTSFPSPGAIGGTTPEAGAFTTLVVGTAGSLVGSVGFRNATSGTITIQPTAGALGTITITTPAFTGTMVVAATSTTTTQALFATSTAGAPAYRAIAAGDLPSLPLFSRTQLPATSVATAAGTTTLVVGSSPVYIFTGTTTQNCDLPAATTLIVGWEQRIVNTSTGNVTVRANGGATLVTLFRGTEVTMICTGIGTAAGTWQPSVTNYTVIASGAVTVNATLGYINARMGVDGSDARIILDGGTTSSVAQIDSASGQLRFLSDDELLVTFALSGVKDQTTYGNLKLTTVGTGIYIKEGANACMGAATLVGGTVVVSNTKVTATSRIHLTGQNLGTITVPVGYAISARTPGVSFTILSPNALDTSLVAWEIKEPA